GPGGAGGVPPPPQADSPLGRPGRALAPPAVVPPHGGDAPAEVEPLRTGRRPEQAVERRRLILGEPEQVALRTRVQLAQARENLVADQPSLRIHVRRVRSVRKPVGAAVLLRLGPPEPEQRADDAVLALRFDPLP